MGSNFETILTLGFLGVGGYFFITQIYPMMQRGISEAFDEGPSSAPPPEERIIPAAIIEDRYPDILVEDRYPDVVVEDRYPDYVPYPYPYPSPVYPPIINPPYCGVGRYWDGSKCKKINCGPGMKWDDGVCRPDCPDGWRWDDGRCKPRSCDNDEYFDGRRCRELPDRPRPRFPRIPDRDWNDRDRNDRDWEDRIIIRPKPGSRDYKKKDVKCPPGYINDKGECKRINRDTERVIKPDTTRERWHQDRDREERMKNAVTPPSPELDRVKEIQEKAMMSFIDIWDY